MSHAAPAPPRGRWQLVLAVQAAASQAAWQGIRLMLAYQALAETGSPAFVGLVVALIAFAGLVASIPSGRLLDRIGGARVSLLGNAVSLLGVILGLIFHDVIGILITSVLVGAGCSQVVVAQQGIASRLSVGASPDSAFGRLTSAVSIGQLVGPPVTTIAAMVTSGGGTHPNTWMGSAAAGVLFLIALPPYLVLRRAERRARRLRRLPDDRAMSLRTVLRNPGIVRAIMVGTVVIVAVDLLSSFVPVWAIENQISADIVGWLLALRALFTIASRYGSARMVARFGRKALLLVTLSLAVLALLLLPFAGALAALPIMAALGIGLGLPQPLTLVWMSNLAPLHARGVVFGARMTVNKVAQITLPVVVATVAGPAGVMLVFWATAGILASGLVIVAVSSATELDASGADSDPDHGPTLEST